MTAQTLRDAAKVLRRDWPTNAFCPNDCNCESTVSGYHPTAERWLLVADWLDDAATWEAVPNTANYDMRAHDLARAILGGAA